jgi:hypothetical protein
MVLKGLSKEKRIISVNVKEKCAGYGSKVVKSTMLLSKLKCLCG